MGALNVNLHGDVITTNHIGDYIQQNIKGLEGKQLDKIIGAISERADLKNIVEKLIDKLDSPDQRLFLLAMADKNPKAIKEIIKLAEKTG